MLLNIALQGMEAAAGVEYDSRGYVKAGCPTVITYADDFVVLCHDRDQADTVRDRLSARRQSGRGDRDTQPGHPRPGALLPARGVQEGLPGPGQPPVVAPVQVGPPQTPQQEPTMGHRPVAGVEQGRDLRGVQWLRQTGHPAVRHRRNRVSQGDLDHLPVVQETQEGSGKNSASREPQVMPTSPARKPMENGFPTDIGITPSTSPSSAPRSWTRSAASSSRPWAGAATRTTRCTRSAACCGTASSSSANARSGPDHPDHAGTTEEAHSERLPADPGLKGSEGTGSPEGARARASEGMLSRAFSG